MRGSRWPSGALALDAVRKESAWNMGCQALCEALPLTQPAQENHPCFLNLERSSGKTNEPPALSEPDVKQSCSQQGRLGWLPKVAWLERGSHWGLASTPATTIGLSSLPARSSEDGATCNTRASTKVAHLGRRHWACLPMPPHRTSLPLSSGLQTLQSCTPLVKRHGASMPNNEHSLTYKLHTSSVVLTH